jgi:hypothetical protein
LDPLLNPISAGNNLHIQQQKKKKERNRNSCQESDRAQARLVIFYIIYILHYIYITHNTPSHRQ